MIIIYVRKITALELDNFGYMSKKAVYVDTRTGCSFFAIYGSHGWAIQWFYRVFHIEVLLLHIFQKFIIPLTYNNIFYYKKYRISLTFYRTLIEWSTSTYLSYMIETQNKQLRCMKDYKSVTKF